MEEKKSKNPFINAAKSVVSKVPAGKAAQVQQAKFKTQVAMKKPASRSAGRGR